MKVKELIEQLEKVEDQDSLVFIEYQGEGGCSTCGFGAEVEASITGVDDLGGKVWLEKD